MSRRVVVTGVGLVSPVGIGTEETWQALRAAKSGIAPITLFDAEKFPSRFAGEVKDFDPLDYVDVSTGTDVIYDACASGDLRHTRLNSRRNIRIKREDIDNWMDKHSPTLQEVSG